MAIHQHYDLSKEFYALILDPHMAYCCAYRRSDDPAYTVEDAQRDKLELVCRKVGLGLQSQDRMRFLDVGCGWASLSLYAAWWGLFVIAASAWPGALTVLSPVVMTYFLVFATGARLLEQERSKRRGYPEYEQRTSYFLPRPPKHT